MRIAGGLIIALCCYMIGVSVSVSQKAVVYRLRGLIRLLKHMENRMALSGDKLFEVYASFCDEALEKCGFLSSLRVFGFNESLPLLMLPPECEAFLLPFGSTLGLIELGGQLSQLKSVINDAEREYSSMLAALPAKQKSTRAVWGLAGALIGLLLM